MTPEQRITEIQSELSKLHSQMVPLRAKLQKLELRFNQLWREKDSLERSLVKVKKLPPKEAPKKRVPSGNAKKLTKKIEKLLRETSPEQLEGLLAEALKEC